MGETKIEWADKVWNPTVGCTPVSEGCRNCYAKRIYERFHHGSSFSKVHCYEDRLEELLKWRKPQYVFVDSMSDLFHEDVPFEFVDEVFVTMQELMRHIFMILTKRPERMLEYFKRIEGEWRFIRWDRALNRLGRKPPTVTFFPVPNVWLGVSIEGQKTADERIPLLLQTPAAMKFVSIEPMLGAVDLTWINHEMNFSDVLSGYPKLDWVIVGGESGPGARPVHPDWVRSLRDQCIAAHVPFFFKQWGEWSPDCLCATQRPHRSIERPAPGKIEKMFRCGRKAAGNLLDGRTWEERPV